VTKDGFRALVDQLLEHNEVVGPRRTGTRRNGKPAFQFQPIERFEDMDLGYEKTEFSAKSYFLPFRETLSRYRFKNGDWQQEISYRIQPRALVGLHACDINALLKLDKVMLRGAFPSPYYLSRRKNTFVIGIDHEPCETGFCASLGEDTVTHGFDLFLTDLGDRYFVSIDSDRGFRVLHSVPVRDIDDDDRQAYQETRRRIAAGFKVHVRFENLPTLLDIEFESPVWKKWGDRCLSCGSCAMVCPTCYCYGVYERISQDFTECKKVRQLYSCNLLDFAMVAGGHNFRPTRHSRLKYRYYHQHRGFMEAYDEAKCVGCNRCGDTCIAGISPPEVIHDLQTEGAS
jgi:ferredoxin